MFTISKARNRKGFTLIELMIVIAIIIILAAIAIPSYLHFVDRAKKAKAAANMGNIAQYLGTFYTDWSQFPVATTAEPVKDGSIIYKELTGTATSSDAGAVNIPGATTVTGENAPIVYINGAKLIQLGQNPWNPSKDCIYYESDTDGSHWALYVQMGKNGKYLYRTDGSENLTTSDSAPSAP